LYFGNSAEFWLKLQTHCDLRVARKNLMPGQYQSGRNLTTLATKEVRTRRIGQS
jgi:plasmid maintenance system antidote protein VapI